MKNLLIALIVAGLSFSAPLYAESDSPFGNESDVSEGMTEDEAAAKPAPKAKKAARRAEKKTRKATKTAAKKAHGKAKGHKKDRVAVKRKAKHKAANLKATKAKKPAAAKNKPQTQETDMEVGMDDADM